VAGGMINILDVTCYETEIGESIIPNWKLVKHRKDWEKFTARCCDPRLQWTCISLASLFTSSAVYMVQS